MSTSDILTFSAPQTEVSGIEAGPSPTLELAYVYYFLNRPDSQKRASELPWLELIYGKHLALVESVKGFWPKEQTDDHGFDLFAVVCELGYVRDPGPERLFKDFAKLPERAIAYLTTHAKQYQHKNKDSSEAKDQKMYQALLGRLEDLREPKLRQGFLDLLKQLWAVLEPFWKKEGQAECERAGQAFLAKYQETGSVLEALPAHHFTQFESSAQHIRKSLEKSRVVVAPLYFASSGGFNFDFFSAHYIGFGIQSERHHQKLAARVEVTANRIKALADSTRLMLLTLIARYKGFEITVSDFASQLGVSQPTVSGHLKLLKEANLVSLEKKGNKSIYSVNTQALEEAIRELEALVSGILK